METVVIVIHLMVILALIAVVLLQRSEGGALGVGGSDQFMTTRGQGNVLTRATTILAAAFFATSLALSILARYSEQPTDILDRVPAAQGEQQGSGGVLDAIGGRPATEEPAPASDAPADAGQSGGATSDTPAVPDSQ